MTGYANTSTNTVVESDCGSVGTTTIKKSTKFADRDIDTPLLMRLSPRVITENVLLAPLSMMEELVQLEKFTYDDSFTTSV
ncbi:hypothetical protein Plhal304r1_c053g0138161 [Plasmopara halstedii]